jgi:hypothetical protein
MLDYEISSLSCYKDSGVDWLSDIFLNQFKEFFLMLSTIRRSNLLFQLLSLFLVIDANPIV